MKQLEQEIVYLKYELAMHDTLSNRSQIVYEALSEQQRYEIKQQVRSYLDSQLDELDVSSTSSTLYHSNPPPLQPFTTLLLPRLITINSCFL